VLVPADVRRLGGTAAKLLVYIRPDREDADGPNGRLVARLVADCAAADLPLVVEVLTYRLPDEGAAAYDRRKAELGLEAALLERDERRAFLEGEGRRRLAELLALLPSADRSPARLLRQTRALADQEESASNLFERDR
jgi:tagatose-1,6-bisphosphate aldolase